MKSKVQDRERAIELRRRGYTYREILAEVPVSKSSLSSWLKGFPLTEREKRLLKNRKDQDLTRWKLRAAASLRKARELRDSQLLEEAKVNFSANVNDSFFQLGIALYWAEGTKRASSFSFINSDPEMVNLMIRWVRRFLNPAESELKLRVFTHKAFSGEGHELNWSKSTGIPLSQFGKTIYKSHAGLIVKKRPNYNGCVRIELGKVKYLRTMLFWQQMLIEYYKKAE
jgi:hypothetical protein